MRAVGRPCYQGTMLGHEVIGSGAGHVVVLNDWLCDTSTWDGARAYLDRERFTWSFTDVRGYGRSRGQTGAFTVEEIAADVLAMADARGMRSFAVVGHSMSTLVAMHLAQHAPDRIVRIVLLTPPPPSGLGVDDFTLGALEAAARGDDARRTRAVRVMFGERLSEGFVRFKVDRWRACADPEAVARYVATFARRGLAEPTRPVDIPVLAVTGEEDAEVMRGASVERLFRPIAPHLEVAAFEACGHYPMQEMPPRLVATVERFLAGDGR